MYSLFSFIFRLLVGEVKALFIVIKLMWSMIVDVLLLSIDTILSILRIIKRNRHGRVSENKRVSPL